MGIATPIPRYDKNQILIIDGKEVRLIDHLSELRYRNNVTKKTISNLVKHNDYWYSQVERSGKKGDDNRQRTIYRPDLIKIISILKYGARTPADFQEYEAKSEVYLDKTLCATPVSESVKHLKYYQLPHGRTKEQQDKLLSALLSTYLKLLCNTYDTLPTSADRDLFLNSLSNMNNCLKIDPLFMIYLCGLPYMDFLYEAKDDEINSFFISLQEKIDSFKSEALSEHPMPMSFYFSELEAIIKDFTGGKGLRDNETKRFEFLPPDQIDFR